MTYYLLHVFFLLTTIFSKVFCEVDDNKVEGVIVSKNNNTKECDIACSSEDEKMACGFDAEAKEHKLFANKCTLFAYGKCHNIGYFETDIDFCIKNQYKKSRRMYGESCPVFCPTHYRPVCGASQIRSYSYRAFNNGCQLDMVNCRGDEDHGYVEVALDFCQRHLMKNIFRTQVVITGFDDYRDYHDY